MIIFLSTNHLQKGIYTKTTNLIFLIISFILIFVVYVLLSSLKIMKFEPHKPIEFLPLGH